MTNININLIKYPLLTSKTAQLFDNNQYTFIVDPKTNKTIIKKTIEFLFNVKIIKITTCRLAKKTRCFGKYKGLKPHYKKAIVKLATGNTINLFSDD
jgi:large subunit ribosomal protein L23